MKTPLEPFDFNRREFLRGGSLASLAALVGVVQTKAQDAKPAEAAKAVTVTNTGVIGLGTRGREAVTVLGSLSNAQVTALCDHYPSALKRAGNVAPKAKQYADYLKLLADAEVAAVVIATPPHQHREIAVAALAAGKHVYLEVPMAGTIDDARAIALAARNAGKLVFQPGLQERSHPQSHFLLPFIRSGGAGRTIKGRTQWHRKTSWRSNSPNPEREKELNWKLYHETSQGLVGEIGIHQMDTLTWFFGQRPKTVMGFGAIQQWKDDRQTADTVQCIYEYPNDVRVSQELTLTNSFDSEYSMIYGTDAAVMMRENKAWMFKESDSPLLGWEVYARKDSFYKDLGIALVANATKIVAQGKNPGEEAPYPNPPLFYALESFLFNAHELTTATKDFVENFGGDDPKALADHLATLKLLPAPKWKDGFEATVVALKANEAIVSGEKITFRDEWFQV